MKEYEKSDFVENIIKQNIPMTCGIRIFSVRYSGYCKREHGDISIVITETDEDVTIWRLNQILENIKKNLYKSQIIDEIYTSFNACNEFVLRCYYIKEE